MDEVYFTREEIAGLAEQLSGLQSLTPGQRKLLLAIFAAAADRTMPTAKPDLVMLPAPQLKNPKLQDLQQQLLNAYLPGNDFDDIISTAASGKITEGPPGG